MTLSAYSLSTETFAPMLRTLSALLDKGAAYASAKGIDPKVLVDARIAPDMFPLSTQVRIACHHAKDATLRLTGRASEPLDAQTGETLGDLGARIARALDLLQATPEAAFEGAFERDIVIPAMEGRVFEMKGFQFLRDWAIPHFYFHVVTAYDLLRQSGVEIGKRDYLSNVGRYMRQTPA